MLSFDAKLVNLTLQGDNTAFDRLVQQHQIGLLSRALSEVHNRSEAEDLVQEAFLHAYQHLGTLKAPNRFMGWLYSITCNLCHDALRKRRLQLELLQASNVGGVPDGLAMPDSLVDGRETSDSLIKAVAALPDNTQQVFLLYLQGWTYRAISRSLHLSVSTVSGRIQRAKRQVKKNFSDFSDCAIISGSLQVDREHLRKKIDELMRSAQIAS